MRTDNFTGVYEKQPDGSYLASVPALPGCHTEGRAFEEAQTMVVDAIRSYLSSLRKHGEPIPADNFKNQFVGS
jgi:antitoxin HicB